MGNMKYNRAKIWQIALFAFNMMSTNMYLYLMSTLATAMRIFDGITDPIIGWMMDHVKGRFGKFRPFLVIGNAVLILSMILMYKTTHLVPEVIRIPYFVLTMHFTYSDIRSRVLLQQPLRLS